MRPPVDGPKLRALARELARLTRSETHVYVTGGATAVLKGWRASTVDVDVRFEPDSDELLRELATIKERLQINIELASPPDFIPELPGWRERSPLVLREGNVHVHHFDLYSQALAKIERGFDQDLADARSMMRDEQVEPGQLRALYDRIEPELFRYPAIDPNAFRDKLERFLSTP